MSVLLIMYIISSNKITHTAMVIFVLKGLIKNKRRLRALASFSWWASRSRRALHMNGTLDFLTCRCLWPLQFCFATWKEIVMMVVGSVCALVHGAAAPLMLLVYGMMTNTFVSYELEIQELSNPNKTCSNNTITWLNGSVVETFDNTTIFCGSVSCLICVLAWS